MGRAYLFICSRCGFKAAVSGGEDRGYLCFTTTIECVDCKKLFDAPTRVRAARTVAQPGLLSSGKNSWRISPKPDHGPTESALTPGELLIIGDVKRTVWREIPLRCPAFRHHRIKPWSTPGKCPRCGVFLEQTAFPYRVWE